MPRRARTPWDVSLSPDKRESLGQWLAQALDNALSVRTASKRVTRGARCGWCMWGWEVSDVSHRRIHPRRGGRRAVYTHPGSRHATRLVGAH